MFLMCIYVITSFIAVNGLLNESINALCLYAFFGYGCMLAALNLKKIKISYYSIWNLIFMAASLIVMGYSPSFAIMSGSFYTLIVSFALTFFFQMFIRNGEDFRKLCWYYTIASLLLMVMLHSRGMLVGTAEERLGQDTFGNANIFASLMMIAVLYELWLLIYGTNKPLHKIFVIFIIIYSMYGLSLSAGRKYVLIPFIYLYLLLIYKTSKSGRKHIILYTLLMALLVGGAYTAIMKVPVLYDSIGIRMEAMLDKTSDAAEDDGSSRTREIMRKDAFSQWQKKPLSGYGFDSYKYRAKQIVRKFFYSHCNYVELLYNGGILYFLLYYWIYYKVFIEAFKRKKVPQEYRAFAIATSISLFIYDYGAISYTAAINHIMFALALKLIYFHDNSTVCNDDNNVLSGEKV